MDDNTTAAKAALSACGFGSDPRGETCNMIITVEKVKKYIFVCEIGALKLEAGFLHLFPNPSPHQMLVIVTGGGGTANLQALTCILSTSEWFAEFTNGRTYPVEIQHKSFFE